MEKIINTDNSRYFLIKGGNTVLQLIETEWYRWDTRDGILKTSIDWKTDDLNLSELSKKEALTLIN